MVLIIPIESAREQGKPWWDVITDYDVMFKVTNTSHIIEFTDVNGQTWLWNEKRNRQENRGIDSSAYEHDKSNIFACFNFGVDRAGLEIRDDAQILEYLKVIGQLPSSVVDGKKPNKKRQAKLK